MAVTPTRNSADEEIVDSYAMWLQSWSASRSTIVARTTLARARLHDWGIDGFTEGNVQEFLARTHSETGKPLSKWTRSTYHAHLSCFCSWLAASGRIDTNPMPGVRKPKPPKSIPRPLSASDLDRVLSVVEGDTRDWIILALRAGLRASEVAKIRGEDVSSDGLFVLGKGDLPVTLPCHPEILEMAQRRPRHGYWFPGNDDGHIRGQQVSLVVGKLFHAIGIAGSIHRVRHTYGTQLMRTGVNMRTVQKLMRHASLATTATYTAVDEDELRAAINLL